MTEALKATAQQVVDRARRMGASGADAFIREVETFSVTVRRGDVESLKEAVSRNLRLRVFAGNRTAASQTSDLSSAAVEKLVDESLQMAQLTSEDDSSGLPDEQAFARNIPELQLADPTWESLQPAERIELARRAEAAAFEVDPAITNSSGGSFEYERSRTILANTVGFVGAYEATGGYLVSMPIAESQGAMQQDYWLSISRHRTLLKSPEEVGAVAAQRALRRLGARKVKTGQVPIVFDSLTARTLVKHIFEAASGDAIYRKRSFLVGQMGQAVAAKNVTLVDDARMMGGLGSRPFDDEGVASQATPVIEHGVLRSYLHSSYTSRKLKACPTGNGSRTGGGSISVGPTNFFLKPGTATPEEIIASVPAGLYVVELLGFGVNTVNGDYSRGVTGIWIENGKLTYPVHEVTIAGNLQQMLRDIEMIGNDITFMSTVAAPTVKLRNMTLSGE